MLVFLLFAGIGGILGREYSKENGWSAVLRRVVKNYVEQQALPGQYILLELLWKQQNFLYHTRREPVFESQFPFSGKMGVFIPGTEEVKKMEEENKLQQPVEEKTEEIFLTENGSFIPAEEKKNIINWEEYDTEEALLKKFYAQDPTVGIPENLFQTKELIEMDLSVDKEAKGPHILLYHTHSQEAFLDSRPDQKEDTIVGAGQVLAGLLEDMGYQVMHHQGEYDVESRDYAYSNSLPEITKILEENPQIQVVLDLHRDAVAEETKLVTTLGEQQVAKVMFFNGLSHSREQGELTYLKNPYLKENLAFSLQMKAACDEYYPGFARNIYLRAYRYNMHVHPKTLLIELGAQTNTVEEIKNALYPLADALDIVLGK